MVQVQGGDSSIASKSQKDVLSLLSQRGRLEDAPLRRRVRADSIAQFVDKTALSPTPQWRTEELVSLLTRSSDLVRVWCLPSDLLRRRMSMLQSVVAVVPLLLCVVSHLGDDLANVRSMFVCVPRLRCDLSCVFTVYKPTRHGSR